MIMRVFRMSLRNQKVNKSRFPCKKINIRKWKIKNALNPAWWYVIQNPKTTRHWKCENSTVAYSKLKCTAQLFPFKFFFLFHHLCIQLVYWLRYMWWLKLNKKFFGSAAMHSRKLFHLFLVSKSNPFSREYRAAWLWLWSINFGYTKLGSFLPKREQVKKIFLYFLKLRNAHRLAYARTS